MNITNLLQRLRQTYGRLKRLLERLRGRKYKEISIQNTSSSQDLLKKEQSFSEKVIYIKNKSDLNNYKEKVKNISTITDFLIENDFGKKYVKYMNKYVESVDKVFQKIDEIDEETTDIVVNEIVGLVENNLLSYLKGCYLGMNGNNSDEEKEFYRKFASIIEQYLQSIGIYEKRINIGTSIRENKISEMFDFIRKPTSDENLIDKINEIELQPHYIKFINEDEEEDLYYIEGLCVVFVKQE